MVVPVPGDHHAEEDQAQDAQDRRSLALEEEAQAGRRQQQGHIDRARDPQGRQDADGAPGQSRQHDDDDEAVLLSLHREPEPGQSRPHEPTDHQARGVRLVPRMQGLWRNLIQAGLQRAIDHDLNKATASLLRSSGWVVR